MPEQQPQKIIVSNSTSESNALSDFLSEYISSNNLPSEILDDLRLVIEEAFVNIVNYAYPAKKNQTVNIELSHSANAISITFIDTGRAFNPITDCKTSIESSDHCDGGMGIHIIKSLTDQQEYNRIEKRNVFKLTKHYTK